MTEVLISRVKFKAGLTKGVVLVPTGGTKGGTTSSEHFSIFFFKIAYYRTKPDQKPIESAEYSFLKGYMTQD